MIGKGEGDWFEKYSGAMPRRSRENPLENMEDGGGEAVTSQFAGEVLAIFFLAGWTRGVEKIRVARVGMGPARSG